MRKIYFFLFALCCFAASCTTSKNSVTGNDKSVDASSIVFAVFEINNDSVKNVRTVKLIKTIRAAGTLKKTESPAVNDKNFLEVSFFENGEQLVAMEKIEHPLFRRMEFAADDGKLKSVTTRLPTAEFFARVVLKTGKKYTISISESYDWQPSGIIASFPYNN